MKINITKAFISLVLIGLGGTGNASQEQLSLKVVSLYAVHAHQLDMLATLEKSAQEILQAVCYIQGAKASPVVWLECNQLCTDGSTQYIPTGHQIFQYDPLRIGQCENIVNSHTKIIDKEVTKKRSFLAYGNGATALFESVHTRLLNAVQVSDDVKLLDACKDYLYIIDLQKKWIDTQVEQQLADPLKAREYATQIVHTLIENASAISQAQKLAAAKLARKLEKKERLAIAKVTKQHEVDSVILKIQKKHASVDHINSTSAPAQVAIPKDTREIALTDEEKNNDAISEGMHNTTSVEAQSENSSVISTKLADMKKGKLIEKLQNFMNYCHTLIFQKNSLANIKNILECMQRDILSEILDEADYARFIVECYEPMAKSLQELSNIKKHDAAFQQAKNALGQEAREYLGTLGNLSITKWRELTGNKE